MECDNGSSLLRGTSHRLKCCSNNTTHTYTQTQFQAALLLLNQSPDVHIDSIALINSHLCEAGAPISVQLIIILN